MYESFKRLCLLVKFRTKNIEDIPIEEIYKYGIKLHLLNTHDRLKIEKNLIFLGFLIVKNKLKENTIETIQALSKAKLKMVMVTGDKDYENG